MGSRMLHSAPLVQSPELVTLNFHLRFGTANVAATGCRPAGAIASTTRTSTGLYTMTLNEKYPVFIGGCAHVMGLTANAAHSQYVNIDTVDYVAATGVLTFKVMVLDPVNATAVADVAAGDRIHFMLTFCRKHDLAPAQTF